MKSCIVQQTSSIFRLLIKTVQLFDRNIVISLAFLDRLRYLIVERNHKFFIFKILSGSIKCCFVSTTKSTKFQFPSLSKINLISFTLCQLHCFRIIELKLLNVISSCSSYFQNSGEE